MRGVRIMERPLYLDFETDGYGSFRPPTQKIVQMGYIFGIKEVSILNSEVSAVNPKVPHPFTAEYLSKHGVAFDEMMNTFLVDLRDCTSIVAHNAKFDLGCLKNELLNRCPENVNIYEHPLYGEIINQLLKKTVIDTMLLTTSICKIPGRFGYKWPSLEELHEFCFHEKPRETLHDALNDCKVTKRSLEHLVASGLLPQLVPKDAKVSSSS